MKIYIDTTSNKKTLIKVGEKESVSDSSLWRSQVVLPMIEKLLADQSKTLQDVSEIEVNPGPGSYTGIRVGVAIANALSFALKVPVKGIEPIYG